MVNTNILKQVEKLFSLPDCSLRQVSGHEGGRNKIWTCSTQDKKYVIRISTLPDRTEEDYLAETEFVHYLATNGAPVADVVLSVNGSFVESLELDGNRVFVSLFEYASGMLISDNGYRYREGAPLEEYFYNTGKTLGIIHRLSKTYKPKHQRIQYVDKYNMDYIDKLIPDTYKQLKASIAGRFDEYKYLPLDSDNYGLVHFDFSDGNYHIDMNTGKITVFDFDNCMNCWYMFDLANLWTHGVGWYQFEEDSEVRRKGMEKYFAMVIKGYRSETDISDEMLNRLQTFIDMVLIENIVDEFECCQRENIEPDEEDIEDEMNCLVNNIPFAGFFES